LPQLRQAKVGTCECIDEARRDLKQRIGGIADAIREAVSSNSRGAPAIGANSKVDACVSNIKKQLFFSNMTPNNVDK
jgi:hypothetical protein